MGRGDHLPARYSGEGRAVAKHTSGIAQWRALVHVRKERKFHKPGPLSCLKRSLFRGGRNFNCVKDIIVASLKRRDFCWLRRQRSLLLRAFLSSIVDWSERPNCSQKNTFVEKFNARSEMGLTSLVRTDSIQSRSIPGSIFFGKN
jgi:hypothetical protein